MNVPFVVVRDRHGRRWSRRTRSDATFSDSFRLYGQNHCLNAEDLIDKHGPLTATRSGERVIWDGENLVVFRRTMKS